MHIAKVIAKVIATQKVPSLQGGKLLVIQPVDVYLNLKMNDTTYVAIDRVGSGVGDFVLVEWGESEDNDPNMVGDMSIVGIIDMIQIDAQEDIIAKRINSEAVEA